MNDTLCAVRQVVYKNKLLIYPAKSNRQKSVAHAASVQFVFDDSNFCIEIQLSFAI